MSGARILIAGCGYVGGRLALLAAEAGAQVWALRRGTGPSIAGVTAVRADLADPASLRALPQSLDGVVFAAGPSVPTEEGYRDLFVEGLRNLLAALAAGAHAPRRLLFTSSTAVYGQSDGEWVDEGSPTEPHRFNGRLLVEAEALLRASPIPTTALRLGGIYGPGRTRRIDEVRDGSARLSPGPPHYTNRIHREDAARVLLHLLTLERVEPLVLAVDGEPAADDDLTRFLALELGLPPPPVADSPPPRRTGSKRCRNGRLVASGYRFLYPSYREGYRALLRAGTG